MEYTIVNRGTIMQSFSQFSGGVEEKLSRRLHEDEFEFLQWLYERYTEEACREINI